MTATSKPAPGSHAAVLDSVVRAVAEGRYRMAHLHLLWHRSRAPIDEMAELVNSATEMPAMPPGLTAEAVLAKADTQMLPVWLARHVENEIQRVFTRQVVAGSTPVQLVARVAAAMCIDVSAETAEAARRIDLADPTLTDERVVADLTDDTVATDANGGRTRGRLIHLGSDTIDLGEAHLSGPGSAFPPPPR